MPRGGAGRGQGRKPGVPNKSNKKLRELAAASGQLPLAYMLEVMRNPHNPKDVRLEAAKAAAPYLHSKMPVSITHQGNPNQPIAHSHRMIAEVQNITVLEAAKLYEETLRGGMVPKDVSTSKMRLVKG